jgi:hypothetical protein
MLLQKVAMMDDFVEMKNRELVLANDITVTDVDALTYHYYIDTADAQEAAIFAPALKDLGDEFPEISVTEISEGSGALQGRGFKVRFEPRVLYYKSGESKVVRTKRKIQRFLAQLIESAVWNAFTSSNGCATTGAEFDAYGLDVGIEGGYSTSGVGQIGLVNLAGSEWNNGGNVLRQIRKVATLMQSQMLIQGVQAYDAPINPRTSVMVMDSITYGILYDELVNSKTPVVEVGLNEIRVPSLLGLSFTEANYAVWQNATTTWCGKANTKGYSLIYDRSQVPVEGYQSLPPLEGYARSGIDNGQVEMLVRDDYDKNGNLEIRFQFMFAYVLWRPKGVIIWGGLRA